MRHCLFFFRMRSFSHLELIVPRETPFLFIGCFCQGHVSSVVFKVYSSFSHFLFLRIVPSVTSQLFSHKLPSCNEFLLSSLKVG